MPVHKVGKDCYQWGNQKVYCGKNANMGDGKSTTLRVKRFGKTGNNA